MQSRNKYIFYAMATVFIFFPFVFIRLLRGLDAGWGLLSLIPLFISSVFLGFIFLVVAISASSQKNGKLKKVGIVILILLCLLLLVGFIWIVPMLVGYFGPAVVLFFS